MLVCLIVKPGPAPMVLCFPRRSHAVFLMKLSAERKDSRAG